MPRQCRIATPMPGPQPLTTPLLERKPIELSAAICRIQETYQRDRAVNAALKNVRIAGKVAKAWGVEALAAERREARRERTRAIADLAPLEKEQSPEVEDRLFSENPDRGFSNP